MILAANQSVQSGAVADVQARQSIVVAVQQGQFRAVADLQFFKLCVMAAVQLL